MAKKKKSPGNKVTRNIVASLAVEGIGKMKKNRRLSVLAYCDAVHNKGEITKATKAEILALKLAKAVIIGSLMALAVMALVEAGVVTLIGEGSAAIVETTAAKQGYKLTALSAGVVKWESYVCGQLLAVYGAELARNVKRS